MRTLLCISVFLLTVAASAAPAAASLRQSQQFTVVDARPVTMTLPGRLRSTAGDELVKLDADVLLLSAERVKEALLSELRYPSEGAGRIRLFIYPSYKPDDLIRVISNYSPGQWEYRVEIPDQIESLKLIRGLVHVLLLEIANRAQGSKSAELPLWLVEGLTLHLMSVTQKELAVGSVPLGSMLRIVRETPKGAPGIQPVSALDSLRRTRQVLRSSRPLSFAELSYPPAHLLQGELLAIYQCSAHLFVYELLHCKDGARSLVGMLRELPRCWNWETALLRGFSTEFSRVLDVEKKWSVDVLAFVARDPSQIWSHVDCLDQLDEVLSVPASVRVAPETLPERRTLTLQQVITTWDHASQGPLLRQKLSLLQALRFHSPTGVVAVIDGYRETLGIYLQKRDAAARGPETRMQGTISASLVAQDAIKALGELDKRREALRPEKALSVNSPISR